MYPLGGSSTVMIQIQLECRTAGFGVGRETGEFREKPFNKVSSNIELNPHETTITGMEPGSNNQSSGIIKARGRFMLH